MQSAKCKMQIETPAGAHSVRPPEPCSGAQPVGSDAHIAPKPSQIETPVGAHSVRPPEPCSGVQPVGSDAHIAPKPSQIETHVGAHSVRPPEPCSSAQSVGSDAHIAPVIAAGNDAAVPAAGGVRGRLPTTTALLEITIHEGRNRQIRRMAEAAGLRVTRLKRIAEGPIRLGDLKPGQWRLLTAAELELLAAESTEIEYGKP